MPAAGPASRTQAAAVRAWLELLRVPNLFTVPGDPLAGFILAGACAPAGKPGLATGLLTDQPWLRAALAALAALCLYARGLITNDVFDMAIDARLRPERPLPSGRIHPAAALRVAAVLGVAGVALATVNGRAGCLAAVALIFAILAYNRFFKRTAILGPLCMGTCRGLSLLLGAAAAGQVAVRSAPVLAAAGLLAAYVAGVTAIAAGESRPLRVPILRRLRPESVRKLVAVLLRLLLAYQAIVAATAGPIGWGIAAALVAAWCVSALLARRFAPS